MCIRCDMMDGKDPGDRAEQKPNPTIDKMAEAHYAWQADGDWYLDTPDYDDTEADRNRIIEESYKLFEGCGPYFDRMRPLLDEALKNRDALALAQWATDVGRIASFYFDLGQEIVKQQSNETLVSKEMLMDAAAEAVASALRDSKRQRPSEN